jgi:hypothetical protein
MHASLLDRCVFAVESGPSHVGHVSYDHEKAKKHLESKYGGGRALEL